jgi:hypothetical protein
VIQKNSLKRQLQAANEGNERYSRSMSQLQNDLNAKENEINYLKNVNSFSLVSFSSLTCLKYFTGLPIPNFSTFSQSERTT